MPGGGELLRTGAVTPGGGRTGTGTFSTVYTGTATSYARKNANLISGTIRHRIKACTDSGCGAYSATVVTQLNGSTGQPPPGTQSVSPADEAE
jgi:hypothetical protein